MSEKYILDGHDPVPVDDVIEWARWFETAKRRVAETEVGPILVSTVFIGLDHSFGAGPPLLFETMTFGDGDHRMRRYSTWDEAAAGHEEVVTAVRATGTT